MDSNDPLNDLLIYNFFKNAVDNVLFIASLFLSVCFESVDFSVFLLSWVSFDIIVRFNFFFGLLLLFYLSFVFLRNLLKSELNNSFFIDYE